PRSEAISARLGEPPTSRVRGAFTAGAAKVFSVATVMPLARGDATEGGPAKGKSASRKRPIRRTSRRGWRTWGKFEVPLLFRHLPSAFVIVHSSEATCHMVERGGARIVTARSRSCPPQTAGAQPGVSAAWR